MILSVGLSGLVGCNAWKPMLRAAWVPAVPLPNGLVETDLWGKAPALTIMVRRGAGKTAEARPVRLQAIHDGRAISLLARWPDATETFVRRAWVWNEGRHDYLLEEYPIDQFAVLWPLTKGAGFCMLDGKPAAYAVWQWRAGWTDLSGYADDRRLTLKPHPKGMRPGSVTGPLYPARDGRNMVEFCWEEHSGVRGTEATEKPHWRDKARMSGAVAAEEPRGGAADVRARGVYTPRLRRNGDQSKAWSFYNKGDDWFVEFYRLLVATDDQEDYQIRGRGPHTFAIAVFDNEAGGDHYTSGPIRLVLDKPPDNPS